MALHQYLTFSIADEAYGIPIHNVREIIRLSEITKIPRAPQHVEGVMNLRGKIIPVTNLRSQFQLEKVPSTKNTCIIIIEGKSGNPVGVIVDAVKEVMTLAESDIEAPPTLSQPDLQDFVTGIGKTSQGVVILISTEKLAEESSQTPERMDSDAA